MLMDMKRRGRPKGASSYNEVDRKALARVADLMVASPALRPSGAMTRLGYADDTVQHRLRRKWRAASDRYLAETRERRQADQIRAMVAAAGTLKHGLEKMAPAVGQRVAEALSSLALWAAQNPQVVQALRNPSPAVLAVQKQLRGKS